MKYYPLKVVTYPCLAVLGALLFYYFAERILEGKPFLDSAMVIFEMAKVLASIFVLPIFMAWVYSEVRWGVRSKWVGSILFSVLSAIGFIGCFALWSLIKHGEFLDDALTPKGMQNIGILFLMVFGLCIPLYAISLKEHY